MTWRDSKTSIILFVRNKDFSLVLDKIASVTDQMIQELSLDNASDSFFEFSQAERYNELFYTIITDLEYIEQLSLLHTENEMSHSLLEVESKNIYII